MTCPGTNSAYVMHMRRGEPSHPECRAAHALANGAWRRANRDQVNAQRRRWRKYGEYAST
jgi:hypothetical protein